MKNTERLLARLEHRVGPVRDLRRIEKGFSIEKKFRVETETGTLLLRMAPVESLPRKKEEFGLMETLFAKGVRCNRPVLLFEEDGSVHSLFHYLPGEDAENAVPGLAEPARFEAGFQAGRDLKAINEVEGHTADGKARTLAKHDQYLKRYAGIGYRFDGEDKVRRFVELNCGRIGSGPDRLLHDDFHLGNIVVNHGRYSGILDFNRFDWGDPLHEFVKLEWYTWPVSRKFARGQVEGYLGPVGFSDEMCRILSVYLAMSIFSTLVWTLKFHPHTLTETRSRVDAILTRYEYFGRTRPEWAESSNAQLANRPPCTP